ncbi:MAG: squalene--hopene cyclase [Pseudomonadota bacterium]
MSAARTIMLDTSDPALVDPAFRPSNLDGAVDRALGDATDWLLDRQKEDGHWVARLETNASMEAEWILALWFMGRDDHPIIPGLVAALLREQRPDGSWQVYHGASGGDVNATVEAYAALRCAGLAKDSDALKRTRSWILERDGLSNIRVFTRYWLALIGEWPWEETPNLPPEIIWAPSWFRFSIYNFASWARATLMPIAILSARRKSRPLPADRRLDELFPKGREDFEYRLNKADDVLSWRKFFLVADRALHGLQSAGATPGREKAIRDVVSWIVDHQDADGVWGGIQPPWIYGLMALHGEGFGAEHPVMKKGLGALDDPRWRWEEGGAVYMQACVSPVWDTVLALLALQDAGVAGQEPRASEAAYQWVLDNQVLERGDWSVKAPKAEPGGWAFEYANRWYPDTDDTAVALIVLAEIKDDPVWRERGVEEAIRRGVDWLFAMQCRDGGWGAFDKDNDDGFITKIPFCDFGEALDPPSVDVTAHILEAFGKLGMRKDDDPRIAKAIEWVKAEQEPDGGWFGRWGVNYVYGAGAVLPALEAIGEDMSQRYVQDAADWLIDRQNADGGWGESCASYMDHARRGRGVSTASQTAWAMMGLTAAGRAQDKGAVRRGVAFLTETQRAGTWEEAEYTGTGFPGYGVGLRIDLDDSGLQKRLAQGVELSRAFMIRYHMYRHYFPMMALARARGYLNGA